MLFEYIKQILDQNTVLDYPHCSKWFDIDMYDRYSKIGVVIIHEVKPIAFHTTQLTGY